MKKYSLSIIATNSKTDIAFTPARYPLTLSLLFIWLLIMLSIDMIILNKAIHAFESATTEDIPFFIFTIIWTIAFIACVQIYVWMLAGKELLTIGDKYISLKNTWLIFSKEKKYLIKDIKNLRITEEDKQPHNNTKRGKQMLEHYSYMAVRFDYNNYMIVFARGISLEDGLSVIEHLRTKNKISH